MVLHVHSEEMERNSIVNGTSSYFHIYRYMFSIITMNPNNNLTCLCVSGKVCLRSKWIRIIDVTCALLRSCMTHIVPANEWDWLHFWMMPTFHENINNSPHLLKTSNTHTASMTLNNKLLSNLLYTKRPDVKKTTIKTNFALHFFHTLTTLTDNSYCK